MTDELSTTDPDEQTDRLAYDVAKQTLVRVVNDDVGTVAEQDPAMQDLIRRAEGNRAVGFGDETTCVEIAYVGIDEGNRTYTMPATRVVWSPELHAELQRLTTGVSDELAAAIDTGLVPDETAYMKLDEYGGDDGG